MTAAESSPDVSVVIPAYNRADLLERCLGSLRASQGAAWEAVVVDNASPEDLSAVRRKFPEVRWLESRENLGYAAANNLGLEGARGRFLCYLNQDVELFPETLARLLACLEAHPEAGAVSPCNVDPDGRPQPTFSPEHTLPMAWLRDSALHLLLPHARPFRDWTLPAFDFGRLQEVATAQTTCFLLRREAYEGAGGMDPTLFLFYNDVDLCRSLRAQGWRILFTPETRVVHLGSASVETAPWKERQLWRDRCRFYRKWYGRTGALATRFACGSRAAARVAAHLVTGRLRTVPAMARLGWELCRTMESAETEWRRSPARGDAAEIPPG